VEIAPCAFRPRQRPVNNRRQALRERCRKLLEETDAAALELQELLALGLVVYRRIIDRRERVRGAWPIGDAHANAAAGAVEGALGYRAALGSAKLKL